MAYYQGHRPAGRRLYKLATTHKYITPGSFLVGMGPGGAPASTAFPMAACYVI